MFSMYIYVGMHVFICGYVCMCISIVTHGIYVVDKKSNIL